MQDSHRTHHVSDDCDPNGARHGEADGLRGSDRGIGGGEEEKSGRRGSVYPDRPCANHQRSAPTHAICSERRQVVQILVNVLMKN